MRDEFLAWVSTFPKQPGWRDGTFKGAAAARVVTDDVPNAIREALGEEAARYEIIGSPGQGDWTHTPWVALLDPTETSSVEEGIYVVYLLSHGCERLYLVLGQGCTSLKNSVGQVGARAELLRRAATIRERIFGQANRLRDQGIDLATKGWRSDLYEAGQVVSRVYEADQLPSEGDLILDLREALGLYRSALVAGGWEAADTIVAEAIASRGAVSFEQAKVYRQHLRIERKPAHSKKVKAVQGTKCRACGVDPAEIYGPIAAALVDAHHLTPLSTLAAGAVVTFDPRRDFAVLCPNCHRVIHRMEDPSDLDGLRSLLAQRHSRPVD